ncbi:ABC transporter substrate-binding protein [Zymomonas sp.]|uniref:MlaC/ttg2D family ABC transporter substrate-binding protein n=1 Tax=Zymomonas sp. TaxID=2068624 RepID=UPI0025EBB754|nr:ABC transporter substrate-binding protein [Zymomonas sp.]MCA1956146.1 ABC transporter substrate-binding protein [Zymomonas sp.]
MKKVAPFFALPFALVSFATPACAAIDNQTPTGLINGLIAEALSVAQNNDKVHAHQKLKTLLAQYFQVDEIGESLVRRWKSQITPEQLTAYKAALPNFIINTYANRIADYSSAKLKIIRIIPAGDGAAVLSQVTKSGSDPVNVIWTLEHTSQGYKVSNMTVGGINLLITQRADFDSVVEHKGFDSLIKMLQARAS